MSPRRNQRKKKREKVDPAVEKAEIRKKEKPQRKFLALLVSAFTLLFTILTVGMTYVISKKHGGLSLPLGLCLFNVILIFVCSFTLYDWLRK